MSKQLIMCIPSDLIDERGFFVDYDMITLIERQKVYLERDSVEEDPSFRQVIPYIMVNKDGKYLAYERKGAEDRLHGFKSMCVGGHIDYNEKINQAAFRELKEEIGVVPDVLNFKGCIALDHDLVSQVHLGLVFEVHVANIVPGAELLNPKFMPLSDIRTEIDKYESWSQEVIRNIL